MTPQELTAILDLHKKWLNDEPDGKCAVLSGADLRGADLSGAVLSGAVLRRADLSGADLSGAVLNWNSHDLIAELLRRAAGDDIDKCKIAGLILISRKWCWKKFLDIQDPLAGWALDVLREHIRDGDNAPDILRVKTE